MECGYLEWLMIGQILLFGGTTNFRRFRSFSYYASIHQSFTRGFWCFNCLLSKSPDCFNLFFRFNRSHNGSFLGFLMRFNLPTHRSISGAFLTIPRSNFMCPNIQTNSLNQYCSLSFDWNNTLYCRLPSTRIPTAFEMAVVQSTPLYAEKDRRCAFFSPSCPSSLACHRTQCCSSAQRK